MLLPFAILFFAIAMLLGAAMFLLHFFEKELPGYLPYTHGGLALTGFVLTVWQGFLNSNGYLMSGIAIFSITLVLGLYLFFRSNKSSALHIMMLHATMAVVAFILVWAAGNS